METRTYFASSVPAALELARKELGDDALLVSSRPAPKDSRSFGRLEVTFAHEPLDQKREAPRPEIAPAPRSRTASPSPSTQSDPVYQEVMSLLRRALKEGVQHGSASQPVDLAIERLQGGGLEADIAREIAENASRRPESFETAVRNELQTRVRVRKFAELKPGESRTMAFMGPTGRGKSTTLVKVAVRFGLMAKIPVRIYSAGVHQVGAAEQMARFAAVLGVPFNWFESTEALHLALEGEKWRGLSLIDTPGITPADRESVHGWERLFRLHSQIERHLVLRADARSADIAGILGRLEGVGPTHLLFTGLDEVSSYSTLVDAAIRSGLPLCLATNGTRIPEDLIAVDSAALIRSVWAEEAMAAAA